MNEQAERLAAGLKDAGCAREDIERALRLQESGSDDELIHCLRKCRCELMDVMHEDQRRIDRIDFVIREIRNK